MMLLQKAKSIDFQSNLVFIVREKFNTDAPKNIAPLINQFIKSKKEFDYFKYENQCIFMILSSDDAERMRVFGYKVRSILDKSEQKITVLADPDYSIPFCEGLALSNYQFLKYFKDAKDREYALNAILLGIDPGKKAINHLNNIIQAVYWSRDLVNEPVSYLNATQLSQEIKTIFNNLPVTVKILEKSKIEALKMGGLLAVNKGSVDPPTFSIIEYKPKNAINKDPIVLVGKGVVYDTGGLSLKPTAGSMDVMKSDMAGAACMAGTIYAAALNELNVHLIGLIPATDNRPGLNAYAPGDVITMYDGTTVEVLNTDAEGRMILADALAYSQKYNPELVIDAATLTGAAVAAIGTKASCLMGNADQNIMNQLIRSGVNVHERLVQLPFWDEYLDEMKSSIADLKNIGGKYAGMITAGKFLEHFTKAPYIHIDIAGPSFLDTVENYKGKGGTGVGVRLLYNFLEQKTNR